MLKLKRVDIHGFKSFYDRTEMRFHGSGIAAIVGPNGCGKSNLSDAISWVLGEQSAKSLRGARMEDVIFAGTRERKPLGMAQVTLTMSDPATHAPLETLMQETNGHHKAEDVTITRRLYRSGESEYLINGKSARLRDIQDLFSGTGLGPESYAIIEQGRIGQILSNKPADRRNIIEEAAGIGKYKSRKRLAEAKLESARQNLSRVFDILEEVGRQANSLKRQAAKAKKYEELRAEMIAHLRRAVSGRFEMLEREAAKLALDLNQAQTAFQTLSASVAEQEKSQGATQESCYRVEAELTAARGMVAELNLESERTRGRLELQARQISGIDQRLTAGETEALELEARQSREIAELEVAAAAVAAIEQESAAVRAQLDEKTQERDRLHVDLRERERGLETSRAAVLRLLGEASTLRNQLAQIDEYLNAMERDATRSRKEEEGALADQTRLETVKNQLSERLSAQQLQLESLADRRRTAEDDLKSRRERTVEARQKLDAIRTSLSREKARKDSLEEILSHRAYTTESVKRLFLDVEHGQAADFKPSGVLADFVEVADASWEKACEEFLHDELEYVVVGGWNEAERGVELMRASSDGRATFLVHPEASAASPLAPDLGSHPGVFGRLRDMLRLTNGFAKAPQGLLPRLARCFLVHDRSAAQALATANPDCYFLLQDGVSYHGHAVTGGKKSAGGPLALKRELRELSAIVETRQRESDELAASLEELERGTAVLAQDLEALRTMQQTQEKDALALDHEQRKLAEEFARAGSRLSVARLELERLSREDAKSRAQRETSQAQIGEKEQARFDQEKALEASRGEFERLQTHAHGIGEEHAALRAGLAGLEERLRGEKSSSARLENQLRALITRREDLTREMERMGVERARLLENNVDLDARAAELAEKTTGATADVERLTAAESEGRAALAALDDSLKALRIEAQAAQERRSEIELELVKKQAELKYLDETSRKELQMSASEVAAAVASTKEADETVFSVEESEQRYQDVRTRIEALGPVNPQALEEFQEAQQRYDFLNTQRQDLIDSIRDTEKAIQELDQESRRRFKEAFDGINDHFRKMFQLLFAGGQGEMRLTDENNLSESGIDIVASPPGKRLQNVLLLSGGEKCLTAMALLMAIFRYTPSPFCILDEVDAPLDEPNIQRLTRLIKDMSAETQFIVITHAKRTMESAQALYGVTMQEPGVSKLVSVKFDAPPTEAPTSVALAAV